MKCFLPRPFHEVFGRCGKHAGSVVGKFGEHPLRRDATFHIETAPLADPDEAGFDQPIETALGCAATNMQCGRRFPHAVGDLAVVGGGAAVAACQLEVEGPAVAVERLPGLGCEHVLMQAYVPALIAVFATLPMVFAAVRHDGLSPIRELSRGLHPHRLRILTHGRPDGAGGKGLPRDDPEPVFANGELGSDSNGADTQGDAVAAIADQCAVVMGASGNQAAAEIKGAARLDAVRDGDVVADELRDDGRWYMRRIKQGAILRRYRGRLSGDDGGRPRRI